RDWSSDVCSSDLSPRVVRTVSSCAPPHEGPSASTTASRHVIMPPRYRASPSATVGPVPAPTPPAERLLNLVIALLNTPTRMTKEQVRRSVVGYDSETTEAFERMFERDKDALRELGIPIVTVQPDGPADEIGYRIDPVSYTLGDIE